MKKHITLIRPPLITYKAAMISTPTPALGLLYLSSYLKQHNFEVTVIDSLAEGLENFESYTGENYITQGISNSEILNKIPGHTDFIGISCMFSIGWPNDRKIIRAIHERFPEKVLFAGGEHITAIPEYVLNDRPEIKFCILGEGELPIVEALSKLDDFSNIKSIAYRDHAGVIQKNDEKYRLKEIDALPYPDWDAIPVENYLTSRFRWTLSGTNEDIRAISMLSSRGCAYACSFCSNPGMWGQKYIRRNPLKLVDEIEYYVKRYNINMVNFSDLNMTLPAQWISEFAEELKRRSLKIFWAAPLGLRIEGLSEEILKKVKDSGCSFISMQPESGSLRTIKMINKKFQKDKFMNIVKIANQIGLRTKTNFIIGFPGEKRSDIIKTLLHMWRLAWKGVDDAIVFTFAPYPGSQLFKELLADGTIKQIDENFFKHELLFQSVGANRSYCKSVGGHELNFYRLFGMALFYLIGYVRHPFRIIRTFRFLTSRQKIPTSLFEARVVELFKRHKVLASQIT